MAENMKFNVEVSDNGTANKTQKNVKDLKDVLDQTAASAAKVGRAVASAAAPTGGRRTTQAITEASMSSSDLVEYNRGRAAGGTGAGARDFAKQAEGLGGLVRVYAAVAANVFALTAAFGALSRAMDTTNMVKGLDQLGAAGGKALGTLSKQLSLASEGAISLRDATEVVAKGSAAGLTSKQILDIGEGAKKASQALGVSLPDALNRLSRGITKIEPELLDELGIYVKIDDATANYARTVGKATSSLTEFEKRQAFAVAVLGQVKEKFGSIELDTNPYTKLLATFQNIVQTGLELVNKVLGPIVRILSESPVALAGILALIGATIIGKVLPAIGQWRVGLRKASEDAAQSADEILKSFGDKFQQKLENRFKIPDLQKNIAETQKQIDKLQVPAVPTTPVRLAGKTGETAEADEKGVAAVQRLIDKRKEWLDTGLKGTKTLSDAQKQAAQTELDYLQKKQAALIKEIELKKLLEKQEQNRKKLSEAFDKAQSIADEKRGKLDPENIVTRQAEKAFKTRDRLRAVSNAAETAEILGVRGAWAALNKEVADNNITGLNKYLTLAQGGIAAVASRVLSIARAFSFVGQAAAAAFALFETVDSLLSKNTKEAEETNRAFESVDSSIKNLDETFKSISKKDPLAQVSSQSLQARGTAIAGIGDSFDALFTKINTQFEQANWWDNVKQGFLRFVGSDVITKGIKDLAASVTKTLTLAPSSAEKTKFVSDIKDLLQIDPTDQKALENALITTPGKFLELGPKVVEKLKDFGQAVQEAGNKSKTLDDKFEQVTRSLQNFIISALPTDPVTKLGVEMEDLGYTMTQSFKDSQVALAQLIDLANKPTKLQLFGPEFSKQVLQGKTQIEDAYRNLQTYTKAIEDNKKVLKETPAATYKKEVLAPGQEEGTGAAIMFRTGKRTGAITQQLEKNVQVLEDASSKIVTNTSDLVEGGRKAAKNISDEGKKFVDSTIGALFAKAALVLRSAFAQRLGDTEAGIQERATIDKKQIDLQIAQLASQRDIIKNNDQVQSAIDENIFATRALTIAIERSNILMDASLKGKDREEKLAAIDKKSTALEQEITTRKEKPKTLVKQALSSLDAQIQNLVNQKTAIDIRVQDELAAKQRANDKDREATGKSVLETAKQELDIRTKLLPFLSQESLNLKLQYQYQDLVNKQAEERADIEDKVASNIKTLLTVAPGSAAAESARKAIGNLRAQQSELLKRQEEERTRFQNAATDQAFENTSKEKTYRLEQEKIIQDTRINNEQTLQSLKELNIDKLKTLGILSAEELANIETQKALDAEKVRYDIASKKLEEDKAKALQPLQERVDRATGADKATAQAALDTATTYYNSLINNENLLYSAKVQNLTIAGKMNAEMAKMTDLATLLGNAFGAVGSALGSAISSITKLSQKQEGYNSLIDDNLRIISDKSSTEEQIAKANADNAKLGEQRQKDEISGYGQIAGAAKGMFKEKTFAYKALAAIEKTMHIARLAMMVKEMFFDTAKTGQALANSATRNAANVVEAGVAGVKAVINAIASLPFPADLIAGGVVAAAVGSLLSSIGGNGPNVNTSGMTAEDRQKTQGTGMAWEGGKQYETGGGVFGDATAKSESIGKSLQLISNTSVEGLTYQDKTVKLLTSINAGITGVAQNAYGVVGLRTGSGFGTQEGTTGKMVLGGLFGSTSSSEILDTGIALKGTFDQLAKGGKDLVQQYETVKTTSTSSFLWIKSTSQSVNTSMKSLSDKVASGITDVFANAAELFVVNGAKLGMTAEQVFAKLAQISTDQLISLKGLKGAELEKELNAVISSILDTAASSVFESLKKYQKFGEGMLETAMRVIDANQKINLALKSTSMVLLNVGETLTEASIAVSEALVEAAGGLDKFLEQSKFFADNFLTEAERLAPVQADLTNRLVALGLGAVNTKEKFKMLVQGLDLSKEADRSLYQSLMDLAPAFNMVYKESEQLLSVEELKSKIYDQETKILQLLGKNSEILARTREKELAELSKYPKAQSDILIANQKYIYALEDEATARDKLKKRVDDTISGLKSAIDNITNYRKQLTLGDKTVLTPQQQYQQAQQEFERLKALATGPAATEADRALQLEAINKLPQAADTFLNLSKTMYASGSQYQTDFASVLATLDTVGVSAQAQLTEAEQQLAELKKSSFYLEDIALSSKTTQELLQEWRDAANKATQAGTGFTAPTMVAGQVSPNQDVVQEVQKLRDEFTKQFEKLREEQAAQAAAQVINNTQVIDNAATRIVDAVQEGSDTSWSDRVTDSGYRESGN